MPDLSPLKLTEGVVKRLPLDARSYFVRDIAVTGLLVADHPPVWRLGKSRWPSQ